MSFTAHPLAELAASALERALAVALALDPGTGEALQALAGRRFALVLDPPDLPLVVKVDAAGGLRVEPGPGPADLRLMASPRALFARLLGAPLPPGALRIAGDLELARTLGRLVSGYRPELDRPFARVFGDLLGPQLARLVGELLAGLKRLVVPLAEDFQQWALDPEGVAVGRAEAEAFMEEVEALRDAVERAERRIALLARELGGFSDRGAKA